MSIDFDSPSNVLKDPADDRSGSGFMSPAEKTVAITRVRYLERQLFDDGGHVRRGIKEAQAEEMVSVINHLRHALGWLEIDLDGRWRWPA